MSKKKDEKSSKYKSGLKKLKKMYENYGINISDMSDREFERLYKSYQINKKDLDKDLKDSERFSNVFGDDDILG